MYEDIINHSHFFQPRSPIWEEELFEIFGEPISPWDTVIEHAARIDSGNRV